MNGRVTLKDIATDINISRTSVHRALNGKEGVNEQLRERVLARAEEMGYTANYAASSLKRKAKRLAVVLPCKEGNGRFYHKYFWDSVEEYIPEASSLNTHIEFYSFDEESDEQIRVLQSLANAKDTVNGLLTMVAQTNNDMRRVIERFSYSDIPVVLLDNDLPETNRFCCVAPHDNQIGRLGAEILTAMIPTDGKIIVAGGSLESASHGHNLKGFNEYISESGRAFEVLVVHEYDSHERCYDQVSRLLNSHKDIRGYYAVTARDTLPLCRAVNDSGLAGTLRGVGSDLHPESAQLLKDNMVQALIYKNAYDKGRMGFRILFERVIKNIMPEGDKITVPISVIMKSNLSSFEKFI